MVWPFKKKSKKIKRKLIASEPNDVDVSREQLKSAREQAYAIKNKLSQTNDILDDLCDELLREI